MASGADEHQTPVGGARIPQLQPISFGDLTGWQDETFCGVQAAMLASRDVLVERAPDWAQILGELRSCDDTAESVRTFLEQNTLPWRIADTIGEAGSEDGLFPGPGSSPKPGLGPEPEPHATISLTGYFEPVLAGARQPSERFRWPLYRKPADLVSLIDDPMRGSLGNQITYARQASSGLEPYPTRQEIECGALEGQGLELLYLEDRIETLTLHIQGSGVIALPDGSSTRVGYDGKNGHPYHSIGQEMIKRGLIAAADMTLDVMMDWLCAQPSNVQDALIWTNRSFIFFKELGAGAHAYGARDIPLYAGRSLAVDAGIHRLGTPIFVSAPELMVPVDAFPVKSEQAVMDGCTRVADADAVMPPDTMVPFRRLMIAHDVGSAIRGVKRGDVFFGAGAKAGSLAGRVRHPADFYVLWPRNSAPSLGTGDV